MAAVRHVAAEMHEALVSEAADQGERLCLPKISSIQVGRLFGFGGVG